VHAVDADKGLILLKGAVPGPKGGLVVLRSAAKSSVISGKEAAQ
jgi:large subunit ribosomal protein L3